MSTADHERFMRRAIALAAPRVGLTADNPAVGCVIVQGGQIIAEAATAPGGRPHAEEQALAAAGERAQGADVRGWGEQRRRQHMCSVCVRLLAEQRLVQHAA